MRWNCPPTAAASDLTESVLASPGTPSTSRWPPQSRATAIRSSSTSWPTMVRLTSKSTGRNGLARSPGDGSWLSAGGWVIALLHAGLSYLRSLPLPAVCAAERAADGHGEPDAGERVLAVGIGERHDDADDHAAAVKQWPARTARVDRRVELNEPAALACVGVRGPVKTGDDAGRHAVGQAERVADRDDRCPDVGASAEGRGDDDLGKPHRGELGDVRLLVGRDDGRVRHRAVGERHGDAPAAGDHMVGRQY